MCQVLSAFPKRKIVDETGFEIVGDVELADGLFQPSIELIRRDAAPASTARGIYRYRIAPITVCIRKELGEDVRSLEGQATAIALLEPHHRGMIGGMTAMIALTSVGIDDGVLRISAKRLPDGTFETGIRRRNSVLVCEG